MKNEAITGVYPVWYGHPVDKIIAALGIAFWWIITIPLILWAFLRTILLYIFLASVLVVPATFAFFVGTTLFALTIYWTPAVAVALQTFIPLITAFVTIGTFAFNILWFLLIALVDLWNILIPLFVVFFIHVIHLFLTVVTRVVQKLALGRNRDAGENLTSFFSDLIGVSAFFADIVVIVLTVIISVLPSALSLTILAARPLLIFFFQIVQFVVPAIEFLFLLVAKLLPAIIFSLIKLVRVFRSVLRSDDTWEVSDHPKYQMGVDSYFNALVSSLSDVHLERAFAYTDEISRGYDLMPDYSHISDPLDRRRGEHLSLHARIISRSENTSEFATRSDDSYFRARNGEIFGDALSSGFHAMLDTMPSLDAHLSLIGTTIDRLALHVSGHSTALEALSTYNTRYGHPALLLAHVVPDIHGSWLGRIVRDSNPDDPFNQGMTHHEWRRSGYPPVEQHANTMEANTQIRNGAQQISLYQRKRMQQERIQTVPVQAPDTGLPEGEIPLPFEMPVILGSDCFRSRPKFILCLPRPGNRKFKAPEILVPVNLPDPGTCKGFVAPPDSTDGLNTILLEMFNPITAIRNTWTYFRYVLSAFSNVFYAINEQTITNPWLAWLFDLLSLNDISEEPLTTAELICLIPYAWYPFYTAILLTLPLLAIPFLWLLLSLLIYIGLPLFMTYQIVRNLLRYYQENPQRIEVLEPIDDTELAQQKWRREVDVLRESRGRADRPVGTLPNDVPAQYGSLGLRPYKTELTGDSIDGMSRHDRLLYLTTLGHAESAFDEHRTVQDRVQAVAMGLHRMGALSPHIHTAGQARRHMAYFARGHPLIAHTSTIAHSRDLLTNLEVALGHRPIEHAVPFARERN